MSRSLCARRRSLVRRCPARPSARCRATASVAESTTSTDRPLKPCPAPRRSSAQAVSRPVLHRGGWRRCSSDLSDSCLPAVVAPQLPEVAWRRLFVPVGPVVVVDLSISAAISTWPPQGVCTNRNTSEPTVWRRFRQRPPARHLRPAVQGRRALPCLSGKRRRTRREFAAEHKALLDAALNHEADLQVALFEAHIDRTRASLVDQYSSATDVDTTNGANQTR